MRRWGLLAVVAAALLTGCLDVLRPPGTPTEDPAFCRFGRPELSGLDFALTSDRHGPWRERRPGTEPPPIRVNVSVPPQGSESHLVVVFVAQDDPAHNGSVASVSLAGEVLDRLDVAVVRDPGAVRPDHAISAWSGIFQNRGWPFEEYPDGTARLEVRWRADLDGWGLYAVSYRHIPFLRPVGQVVTTTGNATDILLALRAADNDQFAKGGTGLAAFAHDAHRGAFEPEAGTEELVNLPAGGAVRLVAGEFAAGADARLLRTFRYTATDVPERAESRDWAAVGVAIEGAVHNLTAEQRSVCGR